MSDSAESPRRRDPEATRASLVEATVGLILKQGFAATSVGQICGAAGVTRGAFFHHFPSKEAIGRAAVERWGEFGTALYAEAWEDAGADPLAQLGAMFAIMDGFTRRGDEVCTCVVGVVSQETAQSSEMLRGAAAAELQRWTENVARLIGAAKQRHCPRANFGPEELAWQLNAVWQGSMLIAKTLRDPALIRRNLSRAREWLAGFFPVDVRPLLQPEPNRGPKPKPKPKPKPANP